MKKKIVDLADEIRFAVYGVTLLGTPLVAYAAARGWIGDAEVQLWSAEVTAAGTLAAAHIRSTVRALRGDQS